MKPPSSRFWQETQTGLYSHSPNPLAPRRALSQARPQRAQVRLVLWAVRGAPERCETKRAGWFKKVLDDLTILHAHDAVGLGGEFVVMGDDHEGRPAGFVQFTHHGKERVARMRIQISSRFISQHEIRLLQ